MKPKNYQVLRKAIVVFLYPILAAGILTSCDRGTMDSREKKPLISDPTIQAVFEARDRKDSDSLLIFLSSPDSNVRAFAAESFASVGDTSTLLQLNNILISDENNNVRDAAAFSIGFMFDSTSARLLMAALNVESSLSVRKTILEGIGKGISQSDLPMYYSLELNSKPENEGMAWGLYRAGVRGVYDDVAIQKSLEYLGAENSFDTRLAASHFFGRSRIVLDNYAEELIALTQKERSPEVLMQLASSLSRVRSPEAVEILKYLKDHSDYRVRVNSYKAIAGMGGKDALWILKEGVKDSNVHVSVACAEALRAPAFTEEELSGISFDLDSLNWRTRATLITNFGTSETAKEFYLKSENPFEKAALIRMISSDISQYDFIVTETFKSNDDILRSRGMTALRTMRLSPEFPLEFQTEFDDILKEAILSSDPTLALGAFSIIRTDTLNYREKFEDTGFIQSVMDQSSDVNLKLRLQNILHYLATGERLEIEDELLSLQWNKIKDLQDEVIINLQTTKGDIRLKLFTNETPASVINFLSLAEEGFYDNTLFHRVVPNFVIQGGSDLGDGSGGPPYSIRTELTRRKYSTGTLGMASAGRDTEGSQFFITHSPTPHLDGGISQGGIITGYTTFGEVIEGMDVVHAIEVSDKVLRIERLK